MTTPYGKQSYILIFETMMKEAYIYSICDGGSAIGYNDTRTSLFDFPK